MPRAGKRRRDAYTEEELGPGPLLVELTLRWSEHTTALFLRNSLNQSDWSAVEAYVLVMHQYARFELVARVLSYLSVIATAKCLRRITTVHKLGPKAVAAYVMAILFDTSEPQIPVSSRNGSPILSFFCFSP